MNKESYLERLKKPEWQKKRLEVLNYANWRCQLCGDKKTSLHVHHSYYTKGKQPWQYPTGSMICLCENCHLKMHPRAAVKSVFIDEITPDMEDNMHMQQEEVAAEFAKLRAQIAAQPNNPFTPTLQ